VPHVGALEATGLVPGAELDAVGTVGPVRGVVDFVVADTGAATTGATSVGCGAAGRAT
jgi:hypothetical protein